MVKERLQGIVVGSLFFLSFFVREQDHVITVIVMKLLELVDNGSAILSLNLGSNCAKSHIRWTKKLQRTVMPSSEYR